MPLKNENAALAAAFERNVFGAVRVIRMREREC
jgi:hypothetical protein